ncbi:hypothetical protein ACNTMW_14905 [Planosporangium sp. 12N6]|uniref:hypothetical protein n=1 Tax=Planosporangium spinosum TaxID=3402278 RepID=UPI003CF9C7AD
MLLTIGRYAMARKARTLLVDSPAGGAREVGSPRGRSLGNSVLAVPPGHLPSRLATGAVILNSGLSKRNADDATATMLHGMAVGTYPFLRRIPPRQFVRLTSAAEIALGAALLLPVVPSVIAGAGLAAFGAALTGLYLRTPGMRQEGSLRPTEQGNSLVKDVWLVGTGLGLVVDSLTRPAAGRREPAT